MLQGIQKRTLIALLIGFLILSVPFANKINADLKEGASENGDEEIISEDNIDDTEFKSQKNATAVSEIFGENFSQNIYPNWDGMNVVRSNNIIEIYPYWYENMDLVKAIRNTVDLNHQFQYFDYTILICPKVEGLCILNYNNQTITSEVDTSITIMTKGSLLIEYNVQQDVAGIKQLTDIKSNQEFVTMIFRLQTNNSTLDSYQNITHIKIEFNLSAGTLSESLITHRSLFDERNKSAVFFKFTAAERKYNKFITTSNDETYITSSIFNGNIDTDPEYSIFNSFEDEEKINSGEPYCTVVVSKWNRDGSTEPLFCTTSSIDVYRTGNTLCIAVSNLANATIHISREGICLSKYDIFHIPYSEMNYTIPLTYNLDYRPTLYQMISDPFYVLKGSPTHFIEESLVNKLLQPINLNRWVESADSLILIMSHGLNNIEFDREYYETWIISINKTSGEIIHSDIYRTSNPHTTLSAYLDGTSLCLNVLEGDSPQDYHAIDSSAEASVSYSITLKTLCEI